MSDFILTTDKVDAVSLEAYAAAQGRVAATSALGLAAAWTVKFGPLDHVFFLQSCQADRGLAPDAPAVPEGFSLQRRERQRLQMVAPFSQDSSAAKVYELRMYDARHGLERTFLDLMLENLPLRVKYSPNFGVFRALTGPEGRVFHMWGYRDIEHRDVVRAQLKHDAGWQAYVAQILPMLVTMQSIILSPIALDRPSIAGRAS